MSQDFDAGSAVVEPFLRSQAARRIDVLVISHGDNDHIGGAASLLKAFEVGRIYTSVPDHPDLPTPLPCRAGQRWEANGVVFEILAPQNSRGKDNDLSCVLKVEGNAGCALLTGDIERPAEEELVNRYGRTLNCRVLVAPHHGSNTSSSLPFIESVAPDYVLIPAGYLNRYGFPHPAVIARYERISAKIFNTAIDGAISVDIDGANGVRGPLSWRRYHARYWNAWTEKPGE